MKIVLLGFGNVGRGFARIFQRKRDFLKRFGDVKIAGIYTPSRGILYREAGIDIETVLSCPGKFNECMDSQKFMDVSDLIKMADIVVDVSPTNFKTGEPSCSYIKTALGAGKHVITANKGPIALCFDELKKFDRAALLFEATVMSGTPLISYLEKNFPASEIKEIQGILNGTTNYILTQMSRGGSFDEALKEAISSGIAEADPSADIEGLDAQFKITILANAILGGNIHPSGVPVGGIKNLKKPSPDRKWKLIARAYRMGKQVKAEVKPVEISRENPFYSVDGTDNAVMILTDLPGEIFLRGPGAGGEVTGFGIFLDLIKILEK